MHYSEDNYGHDDPYGSQRALQSRDAYNPYSYSIENNSYSDRPDLSPHSPPSHDGRSSRLQNSSPRGDVPRGRGSLSSNPVDHSNDPYMTYQPGHPGEDSPRGGETPTRFYNYNDTSHDSLHLPASHSRFGVDASDNYHHSPLDHLSPYGSSRFLAPEQVPQHAVLRKSSRALDNPHNRSSFNEPIDHGPPSYNPADDDRYHDRSFQDHYNDEPDHYDHNGPPHPYSDEDQYSRQTPQNRPYQDEPDNYGRSTPQNKPYVDPHYSDSHLNDPSHYNGYKDNYVDPHSVDQNYPDESPYAQRREYPPEQTGPYNDQNYVEDPYHRSDSYREQPSRNYEHDNYEENPYPDENDESRRYDGLPPVSSDPFADDPFQQNKHLNNNADTYGRISPTAPPPDQYGGYNDRGPEQYDVDPANYDDRSPRYAHDAGPYGEEQDLPGYDDDRPDMAYPVDPSHSYLVDDELQPVNQSNLGAPPDDYHLDGRSPSDGNRTVQWRVPDLQEVIDYLSDPRDNMKANAAAYLQHLCFMDNDVKLKTRGLDGIPPLIELLNNEFPEVQKNACGALKNLSFGKTNEDNKKSIKNAGGIPALVRLLRKTQDDEIKDLVTGILWNLSSSEDLKPAIVDDALAILVNTVILPQSGWEKRGMQNYQPWTTVFRNSTGVLRNVSSAGIEARTKLRECHGLVEALIYAIKSGQDANDIDNKPVENCVCVLRNLSFRIQEVNDPEFYKKRQQVLRQQKTPDKGEHTGCFGSSGKKKPQGHKENSNQSSQQLRLPASAHEYKGLWHPETIKLYLKLLRDSTNPVTIEASTGAIQNLAACDWQPSADARAVVRREKGLPWVVDLLNYENSDKVVCSAATALRNLAIDDKNKELVGKFAMRQLVSMLPQDSQRPDRVTADDTLCAVIATLYEAVKDNCDFGQMLLKEGGVIRLINMKRSEGLYNSRTLNYCVIVLKAMWQFKVLHVEYSRLRLVEGDFTDGQTNPRTGGVSNYSSNHTTPYGTPYGTMSHPISRQGYDDSTLSSVHQARRGPPRNPGNAPPPYLQMDGTLHQGYSNPSLNHDPDRHGYPQDLGPARSRHDEIPMTDMGPGYAPIDDGRRSRQKPPAGGVALFPNQQPPEPVPAYNNSTEPLYAQVNKNNRRRQDVGDNMSGRQELMLNGGGGGGEQGGADSWV